MKKRRIYAMLLASALVLTSILPGTPVYAEEGSGENIELPFEDNFDSYATGTADLDKMPEYKDLKEVSIVELEEGNNAVQISKKGYFALDIKETDKQVQFDFQFDAPYVSWGGLYIKMYKGQADRDDYYFSLNPNYSSKMIISNGDSNLTTNKTEQMETNKWYTCKAVLCGKTLAVKVWERGTEEQEGWDLTYTDPDITLDGSSGYFRFEVDPKDAGNNTWIDNLSIEDIDEKYCVNVNAVSADETMGTVTGSGRYITGTKAVVTAKPSNGYLFVDWRDEKGSVLSEDAEYTFTASEDRKIIAHFEEKPGITLPGKIEAEDFDEAENAENEGENVGYFKPGGWVRYDSLDFGDAPTLYKLKTSLSTSGTSSNKLGHKVAFYLDSVSEENKIGEFTVKLTGSTWNNYFQQEVAFYAPVEGRHSLIVKGIQGNGGDYVCNLDWFEFQEISEEDCRYVTLETNDDTKGSVTGGGRYLLGGDAVVTAEPAENMDFVDWRDEEGNVVSTEKTYAFTVTENCTLTANFKEKELMLESFMASGLTELADIDSDNKTVNLRFASDVDLSEVYPYFYCKDNFKASVESYERMDLSKGDVTFDGWTIHAEQNSLMTEFYVDARKGNDKNDGLSEKNAFQTIQRAQEAVREIENWTGDVIIHLAKGEFNLTETLEFTPEDGAPKGYAVLYQGEGAGRTQITSGVRLTGWEPSTDVPGVEGVYEVAVPEGVDYSRDLYVDGELAVMAQGSYNSGEISSRIDTAKGGAFNGYTITGGLAEMKNWRNKRDIEFVYDVGWTSNILPVQDVVEENGETRILMVPEPFEHSRVKLNCNPNKPSYIQNAFELLDEENEWYFDREAQKIYYIPEEGEDPDDMTIVVPSLERLVEVKGEGQNKVYGLGFEGIGFSYTSYLRPHIMGQIELQAGFVYDPDMEAKHDHDNYIAPPGAIEANYAEGMRVDSCVVFGIAAAGLNYEVGMVASTVTGSRFQEIGAAGIQIGGIRVRDAQPFSEVTYEQGVLNEHAGADPDRVTEDILVMSNIVDTVGVSFKGSIGIWAGYVRDYTLAHNEIKNISYSGVSAGWGYWDQGGRTDRPYYHFETPTVQERYVFENNDISSCMQRLNDGGAIYTLSNMPGSILRGNYIHNVPNPYGAIYLDEATGGFIDISENVVFDVYRPYFYHDVGYSSRKQECQDAQHDNFFTTGKAENPEDPLVLEIQQNAGPISAMVPPEFGVIEEPEEPEEPVSRTTLEYFLNKAKGYVEEGATDGLVESVKQLFADAIAEGEAVMADEDATREEVMNAAFKLMTAIQALDFKAADKTDLEMAVQLADMIDLTKYVEEGQAEFLTAKEAAQGVLDDGDALQADADSAWNALVDAMEALRLKADKSTLQNLVNLVQDLDLNQYTEESVQVFRAAFAMANAVLADEALSIDDQRQVDEAAAMLQAAADGLEKRSEGSGDDGQTDSGDDVQSGGGDDSQPGSGDGTQPGSGSGTDNMDGNHSGNNGNTSADSGAGAGTSSSGKDAPKTGDTGSVLPWIAVLAAAAGTGLAAAGRRKEGR